MAAQFKAPAAVGVFNQLDAYAQAKTTPEKEDTHITQDTQVTQHTQQAQVTQHNKKERQDAEIKTRRVSIVLTPTMYQDAADLACVDRLSFNSLVAGLIGKYIQDNRARLDTFRSAAAGKVE